MASARAQQEQICVRGVRTNVSIFAGKFCIEKQNYIQYRGTVWYINEKRHERHFGSLSLAAKVVLRAGTLQYFLISGIH